jgi:First Longin domain of INTU, CCZ1 and HPS4
MCQEGRCTVKSCSVCMRSSKIHLVLPRLVDLERYYNATGMSTKLEEASHVVPAQLSFLAIYNPSLGKTDESLREQIVFYSSTATRTSRNRKGQSGGLHDAEREEENEQLRQVGLAQGMVDFAKWVGQIVSIPSLQTGRTNAALETSRTESLLIPSTLRSLALYSTN